MMRSHAEVKDAATVIVNRIVADMMTAHPSIRAAIHQTPRGKWNHFLDELYVTTEESLINTFGAAGPMKKYMREDSRLPSRMLYWRWGWRRQWHGWHRLFWFAFMLDTRAPVVGVVFFGLSVTYGRNVLERGDLFTNAHPAAK